MQPIHEQREWQHGAGRLGEGAEGVASIAVIASLIYLLLQVRQSNPVASASARHSISEFALQMSLFHAEHADRLAKVHGDGPLSDGDRLFRWWRHMQVFLHAETYYRHHELGLMPPEHWQGYVRFVEGYLETAGVHEFWADVGPAFSARFSAWIDRLLAERR